MSGFACLREKMRGRDCLNLDPDSMCEACRATLGYPFDLAQLRREIDADGIGWTPARAREAGMPPPLVVFIRDDGWSLGASGPATVRQALDAWRGSWRLFALASEGWRVRPFSEYGGVE